MKKYIGFFIGFVLLFLCKQVTAQDIIFKKTGEEVKAKVLEVTPEIIRFTQPEVHADSVFTLSRKEVFMIKYANGVNELMQSAPVETTTLPKTPQELVQMGRRDAVTYYSGDGALALSALVPPYSSIIVAIVPPSLKPTNLPDPSLLQDPYYRKGYRAQAHKRKIGRSAIGACVGIVVYGLIGSALLSGYN